MHTSDRDEVFADHTPFPTSIVTTPRPLHEAIHFANRELLRPPTHQRAARGLEPYSSAWFDELEQKRYTRHGAWLPTALELGRHPGESVLMLGPGLGSDVIRYVQQGTEVTIGITPADSPELIRLNLARHGLDVRMVNLDDHELPFHSGEFDVVVWNALHSFPSEPERLIDELFRVLKANGKVIGFFPARYDTGFWQDVLLPLQWLYWRRSPDPTTAPKRSARELRRVFAQFTDHRVAKRHLRRSELPHLWRTLPLILLERIIGRVLVMKAFKPLNASKAMPIKHSRAA